MPLSESALKAIGPRSMVIDIYICLAYRLHALKRSMEVSWAALNGQFGAGFGRQWDFRKHFLLLSWQWLRIRMPASRSVRAG